ncbi:MAG TPA: serine hydrolase domain-containing protein [Thermoanaerobaculia bacterium]
MRPTFRVLLLVIAAGYATAAAASDAAALARKFVELYNAGKAEPLAAFLGEHLSQELLAKTPAAERAASFADFRTQSGPFVIRELRPKGEELFALVQSTDSEAWFGITFRAVAGDAHELTKLSFSFADAPTLTESEQALAPRAIAARTKEYVDHLAAVGRFKGTVLLAHHGKPLLVVHHGPDTPQSIASVGKLFTSVAIARLVADGKLSLDDLLGRVLPDYPNDDAKARVTVRHLLAHTSGLPDYMEHPDYAKAREAAGGRLPTLGAYLPFFASAPLQFAPGEKSEYSNSGYLVLGLIVEHLSGMTFEEYVAKHIFAPAKMTETPVETVRPAGGELTTVADLLRFANALASGALLPRETNARLLSTTAIAGTANEYGVEAEELNGHHFIGHGGGAPGMSAELDLALDDDYALALIATHDDRAADNITKKVQRLVASGRARLAKE